METLAGPSVNDSSSNKNTPKDSNVVDDPSVNQDLTSSIVTLEPYDNSAKDNITNLTVSSVLHAKPIPLDWSFDVIYGEFSRFGSIREIRNRLGDNYQYFESWIIFNSDKDALRASNEFHSTCVNVSFSMLENVPRSVDIYRPQIPTEDLESDNKLVRSPEPPRWLIISSRSERGNLFKVKQFVNQKLGNVNSPDISRFGRNSFLVHAKSDAQAVMLLNMKLDTEGMISGIKAHFNFSYAKGVIFSQDIYDLSEEEILTMCPEKVWKIFKIPRSHMIILNFVNSIVPPEIIVESEIIRVRPYRPRALQCFNCYGFGHASRICTRDKICQFCSQPEHGECSRPRVCANCKENHDSRNKSCKVLKKEEEALLMSEAEHISIGHAKKLLSKRSYSDALKDSNPNSTVAHTGRSTIYSETSRVSSPQMLKPCRGWGA